MTGEISVEARSGASRCVSSRGSSEGAKTRRRTNEDDEAHREAAETAHAIDLQQFDEVVDRRVDPAATLRHQDLPLVRSDRLGLGVTRELGLVLREVLEDHGGEVSILAERQQVLREEVQTSE